MKLSARRSLAVLVAGAALVTAGCSAGDSGPDRAAVVDGTVISQDTLQTTMRELNDLEPSPFGQALDTTATLTYLIKAPALIDELSQKGVVVSESVATRIARDLSVRTPSDGTVRVIQSLVAQSNAASGGQWTDEDDAALSEQLSEQGVVVNPRYGTFDPENRSVAPATPEWIRPADADK